MIDFIRGQTTKIYAEIPADDIPDMSAITSIWFMLKQGKELKLDAHTEDCYIIDRRVYTNLSQEETLNFNEGYGKVQISLLLSDGERTVSYTDQFRVHEIIKEGVQNE